MSALGVLSARRATKTRRVFAGFVLLGFLLSGGMVFGEADRDLEMVQPVKIPSSGMKSGRLTAKHENSASISGEDRHFHSKIVFADDEGEPVRWDEFKIGDEVQYHLKQERIDYLILVRPK